MDTVGIIRNKFIFGGILPMCKHRRIPHKLTKGFFQLVSDSDSPVFTHRYPPPPRKKKKKKKKKRKFIILITSERFLIYLYNVKCLNNSETMTNLSSDMTLLGVLLPSFWISLFFQISAASSALACPFSRDIMVVPVVDASARVLIRRLLFLGPKVINRFSCSTQLSTKFDLPINSKSLIITIVFLLS